MNAGLLIVILLLVIGLVGYTVFLVRQQNAARHPKVSTYPPFENRPSKISISDSQIYKETKGLIKNLRTKLDSFADAVDAISNKVTKGTSKEMDAAYKEGIPKMHKSLVDSLTAARVLHAAVKKQPLIIPDPLKLVGYSHHAPKETATDGAPNDIRTIHFFSDLVSKVNKVNPCIAGFYMELAQQDEKSQLVGAAGQIELMLEYLEDALNDLIAIEVELSEG